MDMWQAQALNPPQEYCSQFGPLSLWVKKVDDEIHVGIQRDADERTHALQALTPASDPPATYLERSRWIVDPGTHALRLLPCLPNRPVVVRTDLPVKIPAGKTAVFFVSIPLWLHLQTEAPVTDLGEYPTVIRSNIWFGDVVSGELCYSLISRARRNVEDADHPIYKAVCPVKIRNLSKERLDIERFCVHVQHLSLYQGKRLLWTNEVTVTFQGKESVSKLDYARTPPSFEKDLTLVTPPRTPLKEKLLKRSLFSFVRQSDL